MDSLTPRKADVVVVGGGPAGAATAWALARNGADVLILDRAHFPRPKACAEFLSPQARRILADMGALDAVIRSGAPDLEAMTIHAVNGQSFEGRFDAARNCAGQRNAALGVRRDVLDSILLDCARAAGARVAEGVAVTDLVRDANGRVTGVRAREGGHVGEIAARIVVGADGLRSVVGRRLGLIRSARWPRRVGFAAHYTGIAEVGSVGEMYVTRNGYCGLANVGGGVTNVGLVMPVRFAAGAAGDAAGFMERWIRDHTRLAPRFANATRVSTVLATGPFAVRARRAWAPGVALVGDAAEFFDPFTGEGMFEALRGGEILGPYLCAALASTSPRVMDEALAAYERARRYQFAGAWRMQKIAALAVAFPPMLNHTVRAANNRRAIADLVVNVASGFLPPSELARPGILRQLLFPFGPPA
jgi:flavin-dependent dehydrogenase